MARAANGTSWPPPRGGLAGEDGRAARSGMCTSKAGAASQGGDKRRSKV